MNEASSLASQMIGQAISSGAAQRAKSDVVCRSVLSCSTVLPAACARLIWKLVSVEPGRHVRLFAGERPRHGEHAGLGGVVESHASAASDGVGR